MLQISFYAPNNDAELVKNAMFSAGAGKVGCYSHCSWQTYGVGQFMPTSGAKPAICEVNQLETLAEIKIEMVCSDECIEQVVSAMKASHPYEEVAYSIVRLLQPPFNLENK